MLKYSLLIWAQGEIKILSFLESLPKIPRTAPTELPVCSGSSLASHIKRPILSVCTSFEIFSMYTFKKFELPDFSYVIPISKLTIMNL